MNRSVTTDLDQYESLFGYLKMMQSYSLLEPGAVKGNVVLADDQYVTKQQMRMNFGEMGISEKLVLFSDGKNVSDYFDEVLDALDLSYKNANKSQGSDKVNPTLQPVALLLLDINMPIMTGMEVMLKLKKKYNEINEKA